MQTEWRRELMRVYHGSYIKITEIDLKKCRLNTDFGHGFYVTKFIDQASNWAKRKGVRHQNEGVITEFNYIDSPFTEQLCNVLRFDSYSGEWLDFVVMNRNLQNKITPHSYDIVEGPVADDKIVDRITAYINGDIPKLQFLDELKFQDDTHQICFCTRKSLLCLESVTRKYDYSIKQTSRNIIAALVFDRNISIETATDLLYTSATFVKLAEDGSGLTNKSWQEIYELLKTEIEHSEQANGQHEK
jgi:hypothetical protein